MKRIQADKELSTESFEHFCRLCSLNAGDAELAIPLGTSNDSVICESFINTSGVLVSGTTGCGKTSFLKTLILELMHNRNPDEIRFAIYDSLGIEYGYLNSNPFLWTPVAHSDAQVSSLVHISLTEAERRMKVLSQDATTAFPHLFVILDDYGAIAQDSALKQNLIRLLQIARRTNIHLVLSTSIPSSQILSPDLLINIDYRIAFRVSERSISRIVLDVPGAETLAYPGEILINSRGALTKCSAVYLPDEDVQELSNKLNELYSGDYPVPSDPFENLATISQNDLVDDPLIWEAAQLVVDSQLGSPSALQRHLKIGYARAGRIMDDLEMKGIVGPPDGSKPREVLIDADELEELRISEEAYLYDDLIVAKINPNPVASRTAEDEAPGNGGGLLKRIGKFFSSPLR